MKMLLVFAVMALAVANAQLSPDALMKILIMKHFMGGGQDGGAGGGGQAPQQGGRIM